MPRRVPSYPVRWCAALLVVSVAARLAWTLFTPNGMNLVDLHVYVDGSAALLDGDLYNFTYSRYTPDFPLPFTYPPFAALIFLPLHVVPFEVLGVAWQLLTVAALFFVVRIALELVIGTEARTRQWTGVALAWTAVGIWTEPLRTTLDYGQINVFLVLGVMVAVRSSRWWLSGGLVGILAGIKLTPAITGLYFLARRRWREAVFSAIAFAATVVVSVLALGEQGLTYFTTLFGDADRIGPVGSVWNQSLRGALSRIVGEDVETGPLWLVAVVVCAALAFAAWRSLGKDDLLGTLLVVQLLGLLVSPISWAHHWVWVIPMLIWLLYGPLARLTGTRILAAFWAVVTLVGVPWVLSSAQDSIWTVGRPAPLAWLGTVYVTGAVLAYVWMIVGARKLRDSKTAHAAPAPVATSDAKTSDAAAPTGRPSEPADRSGAPSPRPLR